MDKRLDSFIEFIKSEYKGQPALFVGNGINLLSQRLDWSTLLKNLVTSNNLGINVNSSKSYPLLFEEILFSLGGNFRTDLKSLKVQIADELKKIQFNNIHSKLTQLKITEYLTTNYDYTLQQSLSSNYYPTDKSTDERTHSLHRSRFVKGNCFWHLHGEIYGGYNGDIIHLEKSILIGNEQYSDYQNTIYNFIRDDNGRVANPTSRKSSKREKDQNKKDSWVYRFFYFDLHIAGFGFDFNEHHLWWLLNFRARLKKEYGIGNIPNKIFYYYPNFDYNSVLPKLQLMEALGVATGPINGVVGTNNNNYLSFWDELINKELNTL